MSILDTVRKWIDGDSSELVLEQAARDAQVKPRSKSEEYIVKIAKAVESVMQNEMVPLPQGTIIIPSEYTIFINGDDDKEWQGVKRKGLEQGLYHILAERAKEIAGKKKLETKSFVIELRIDGTLERGDVRVQHSWDEASSNKTSVLSRPKNLPPIAESPVTPPMPMQVPIPMATPPSSRGVATNPDFAPKGAPTMQYPGQVPQYPGQQMPQYPQQAPSTLPQANIPQAMPLGGDEGEEMTHVASRLTELYRLEIWRSGVRQNVVPIYQKEISIGRGSKSKPVDIPLVGDVEISRRHMTLITDGMGNFWALNEGKNPAAVNNYEMPNGQRFPLAPGAALSVCSYMLRIQPR